MKDRFTENLTQQMQHLAHLSQAGFSLFDFDLHDWKARHCAEFCRQCDFAACGNCDMPATHRYGCFEAERWNGMYIYYCPAGLIFIATILYREDAAAHAAILGPLLMGLPADVAPEAGPLEHKIWSLPSFTPERTTSLAQTQWMVSMFLSGRSAEQIALTRETREHLLQSLGEASAFLSGPPRRYPIRIERRLQSLIAENDREGALALLNEFLGSIYFGAAGDFDSIKARSIELAVLLSRVSVDARADVRQLSDDSAKAIERINACQNLEELSEYLAAFTHRFVGYVFDFRQVKHVDIIHKTVDYIRQNYDRKLSLDDVAAHVYLSRSYLSKIFKEEMHCNFTSFVNTIRVEKSKELLLDESLSLVEIASLVGFEDQSYFTRVFKKVVGMSPGKFRENRGVIFPNT